jgi:hypothetical protein
MRAPVIVCVSDCVFACAMVLVSREFATAAAIWHIPERVARRRRNMG